MHTATLYYAHDPMCSWCWGFRPVWQALQAALADKAPGKVRIHYLLGGLAADTDQPMPEEMQINIRDTWRSIQKEIPGTRFNLDFWTQCQPRRSTWPACRAIIACRMQAPEREADMLLGIQQAYYLQARNPSDLDVLCDIAAQTGLDVAVFRNNILSDACQRSLLDEMEFCRSINISSFPSLVLKQGRSYTLVNINYTSSDYMLTQVLSALSRADSTADRPS